MAKSSRTASADRRHASNTAETTTMVATAAKKRRMNLEDKQRLLVTGALTGAGAFPQCDPKASSTNGNVFSEHQGVAAAARGWRRGAPVDGLGGSGGTLHRA